MKKAMIRGYVGHAKRRFGASMLLALSLGTGGCAASAEDDETLGERESALGELACRTEPRDDIADIGIEAQCAHSGYSQISGTNYDHDQCPNQFIVGYGSASGSGLHGRVVWADTMPTTSGSCVASRMTLVAYTQTTLGWLLQPTSLHGVWQPWGGGCKFFYDSGSAPLDNIPGGSKHRLVASAFQLFITGPTYRKVQTRLYYDVGPC